MAHPLYIVFVLKKETLYLVLKGDVLSFHLPDYGFDVNKDITVGKNANHLFGGNSPLKEMRTAVRKRITQKEFLLSWRTSVIFISDRPLNNLGIWHYDCLAMQFYSRKTSIYYDPDVPDKDILDYTTDFINNLDTKDMIGRSESYFSSYWYKEKDNSIEEGDRNRKLG